MSIKSTRYIGREEAIERIKEIHDLASRRKYRDIEKETSEYDYGLKSFIDSKLPDISDIDDWTDTMVEDLIDRPFFRYSMFDNYYIKGE